MQRHRAGPLKQVNKAHKGGKRNLSASRHGKVDVKTITRRSHRQLSRDERRHQAMQSRRAKWEETVAKKRNIDGKSSPFVTCIVPLNNQLDTKSAIGLFSTCRDDISVATTLTGIVHINVPAFKQRFSFICPDVENEFEVLDALKVADSVLFLTSAVDLPIDEIGEKILASAIGQGVPSPTVALMDLESLNPKKRTSEKQNVQKMISKWLPEEKVFQLDNNVDALNVLRRIGNQKKKHIHFREKRSYMLVENYEYNADNDGDKGTLSITGYLKGIPLSVNSLIHIPYLGDFQMSHILSPQDPHKMEKSGNNMKDVEMNDENIKVLETANPLFQESLVSENTPDPMNAEQTWPSEEEIQKAQEETNLKNKLPKGTSDYQATWIEDIEDNDDQDSFYSSDDEDQENFMSCNSDTSEEEIDKDDIETMTESEIGVTDDKYDQNLDEEEEKQVLDKIKAARDERLFPDEVDTPDNIPAKERFQKYRGLESFRTSPWDPKENLPEDYARIFQFKNFDHTRKRIFKEAEERNGALPGWYITLEVANVPQVLWDAYVKFSVSETKRVMVVFGLLPHEHKMSVVNVVLKRTGVSSEPIKSKEKLLIQAGYRRYVVSPIFSQHTNGSKHKYERFFQPSSTCVATFFAPIHFSPMPVLCYKIKNNKPHNLIATGCVLSCNPDRLIIKRIVLSGHPFKVHKRSAVIRFMFFNREDILYYKPCRLRTKYGRSGHIKEPLGTHGHMKCVFDSQLKSQDTVLLSLYKRVFPKWNYEEWITQPENEVDKFMDLF